MDKGIPYFINAIIEKSFFVKAAYLFKNNTYDIF